MVSLATAATIICGDCGLRCAGTSGRDIRDVCQAAARKWAARRVRNEAQTAGTPLPPVDEYERSLAERLRAARDNGGGGMAPAHHPLVGLPPPLPFA